MRRLLFILLLLPCFAQGQSVHITAVADTVCNGLPAYFTARATGTRVFAPYYLWRVNGIIIYGSDDSLFTSDSLHNGDTVECLYTYSALGSILAYSNGIVITVLPVPLAGIITGADTNVCAGTTITLNDTVTGGVWSASNHLATVIGGVVTGLASYQNDEGFPSTVSIYYVVSNGYCSDTTNKIINVEGKPDVSFTLGYYYGSTTLCVGGSLSINNGDGANGTMYSTGDHVSVSEDYVYGESAGTDYIFCTATNNCGSDTSWDDVTVYSATAIFFFKSSSTNVCVGATIATIDSTNGYPSWKTSNANASVNSYNGEITGWKPGLVTITLGAGSSCGGATASIEINVEEPQSIMGVDSFCMGEKAQFLDGTSGGLWSSSDTALVTIDHDGIATGSNEGGVLISYTSPLSGCSTTWRTNVYPSVIPSPITGDADFCLSSMRYLSDSTWGGVWTSSNTVVARVDVNGEVSAMSNGTATITYSLGGCTQAMEVSVIECGNEMKIFPNPGRDEVTIYSFDTSYNTYTFFNAVGQEVTQGSLAGPFTTINVALLMAGYYTIVITGEGEKYVGKFVKD